MTHIPNNVVFADWHQNVYTLPRTVTYTDASGTLTTTQLLDLDLRIDFEETNDNQVGIIITSDDLTYRAVLSLETDRLINASEQNSQEALVTRLDIPLDEFLNHYPPVFYTSDFSSFQDFSLFPPAVPDPPPFGPEQFEVVDWSQAGVNIENEFRPADEAGQSIHHYLRERLIQSEAEIVFYDHGPGEIADFVALTTTTDTVRVSLYHCKASSEEAPGGRVDDAYEVCGQAAKCDRWADPRRIIDAVRRRLNREHAASRFEKGNMDQIEQAFDRRNRRRALFEAVIVQPGFSLVALGDRIPSLLAATDAYLFDGGRFDRVRVIGSA